MKKKMKDLSGDGKVTKKDVLIGRGVIKRRMGGTMGGGMNPMGRSKDPTVESVTGYNPIKRKSGGMAKGSREGSVIKAKKGTHVTKDGRTAKKGLYYNMNKRRKAGTSRPGKGTVSAKALKQSAKTAFKPKKKR
tara:strand:+ start:662 stop:1063 length:402 start_codon:yes stop_codon:yes gene_type:complete